MKFTSILVIVFLSINLMLYGQKTADFGTITVKDLAKDTYSADTASAVILFDVGSLELEPNSPSGTTLKRHMRVKILKSQAFGEWGNVQFYVGTSGSIKIKGATFNLENGVIRKTELEESSIMTTKYDSDTDLVRVAFPNVKVGSIVEFTSVKRYPDFYIPGWRFQYDIPSRHSEYTISVPVKKIAYHLKGSIQPTKHEEKYDGGYHHWLLTEIPPFVSEPLMPEADAYISYVEFATRFYDWDGVYYSLKASEQFSAIVDKYKYLQKTADDVTAGFTDERQKIKAISNYVKERVKYNGVDSYFGDNPTHVLDKTTGSSGEINLLFGSLLKKAGLKVNMVLLSTRDHGTIERKVPSLSQFNYVICEVTTKEGELLVDATEKLLPYDMLPPRCYNYTGFLVGDGQFGWIPIDPKHKYKILLDATVTFLESGGVTGKLKAYKDGFAGFEVRRKYSDGGAKDYKIDLGNKLWNVQKHEVQNISTLDKPLEEYCEVSMEDFAIKANDKIYFNPYLFFREETNPFNADTRTYPVDFERMVDKTVVCNLVVPDNYIVEELPENKVLVLPGNAAKCTFSTTQTGNKIMVMSKLQFNKTFFLPSEYLSLREFYGKLVAKKAENIVLKQKQ